MAVMLETLARVSTEVEHSCDALAAPQSESGKRMLIPEVQVNVVSLQLRQHLAWRRPVGMTGEDARLWLEPGLQILQAFKHGVRSWHIRANTTSFRK